MQQSHRRREGPVSGKSGGDVKFLFWPFGPEGSTGQHPADVVVRVREVDNTPGGEVIIGRSVRATWVRQYPSCLRSP